MAAPLFWAERGFRVILRASGQQKVVSRVARSVVVLPEDRGCVYYLGAAGMRGARGAARDRSAVCAPRRRWEVEGDGEGAEGPLAPTAGLVDVA